MIEMVIAGLEGNIRSKLEMIRMSNPLYYYHNKTKYERLRKNFKKSGMRDLADYKLALEELLEGLDDLVRGDFNG